MNEASRGRKPLHTRYISELRFLVAPGLNRSTSRNEPLIIESRSLNRLPWKAFSIIAPPALKTSEAMRTEEEARLSCRAWSSSHIPVRFGEASESTTSAFLARDERILWARSGASMSLMMVDTFDAESRSIGLRSTPNTWPLVPTRSEATCSQPPGAAPKSTTISPGLIRPFLLHISMSLKTALLRYPNSLACR